MPVFSRLALLAAALSVGAAAGAQDVASAQAQAERQFRANLEAQGLTSADIDYVVGCSLYDEASDGETCDDDRIVRILTGPEVSPPPPAMPPPPPIHRAEPAVPLVDAPDTSTASVWMSCGETFTFDGRAYHTGVDDDFAVLALVTSPLVDGTFQVPEDDNFSFIEARLFDGLRIGRQGNVNGFTLYRWGPGGTSVDGPIYQVREASVEIESIEDGIAQGTISIISEALDDDTRPGEGEVCSLEGTFRAVAGRIPPP